MVLGIQQIIGYNKKVQQKKHVVKKRLVNGCLRWLETQPNRQLFENWMLQRCYEHTNWCYESSEPLNQTHGMRIQLCDPYCWLTCHQISLLIEPPCRRMTQEIFNWWWVGAWWSSPALGTPEMTWAAPFRWKRGWNTGQVLWAGLTVCVLCFSEMESCWCECYRLQSIIPQVKIILTPTSR